MASAFKRYLQQSPKWARALLCLAASCALCLFLALCARDGETDDDWSIALYLSDRLPATSLSLYVNALLSRVIYALNRIFPQASWFFVLEHISACMAFAALLYACVSYVRLPAGAVLITFVLLYVLPYCIAQSNYTYVAGLSSLTGGLLLVAQLGRRDVGRFAKTLPALLLALGLLWRIKMWLLCLPFVALAYVWALVCRVPAALEANQPNAANGVGSKDSLVPLSRSRCLAPACGALVLCLGLIAFDAFSWSGEQWSSWRAYDQVRSPISDYNMPDYDEVANELASMGVSENDYYFLRYWGNADIDVLNTEVLSQVSKLRVPAAENVGDVLRGVRDYAVLCVQKWKAFALIALAVLLVRYRRRSGYVVAFAELAMAAAAGIYFLLVGRLLSRVEDPMWACALAMCVALSEPLALGEQAKDARGVQSGLALPARFGAGLGNVLSIFGCLAMFAALALTISRNLPYLSYSAFVASWHQDTYLSDDSITGYLEAFPDMTFVMETGQHTRYELAYGFRYLPQEELASRVIPLGGWGSGSPFRRAQCEAVGASNPFEALLTGNQTVLVADEEISERVLTFLREHYDPDVSCSRLMMFPSEDGSIHLWRYSVG